MQALRRAPSASGILQAWRLLAPFAFDNTGPFQPNLADTGLACSNPKRQNIPTPRYQKGCMTMKCYKKMNVMISTLH